MSIQISFSTCTILVYRKLNAASDQEFRIVPSCGHQSPSPTDSLAFRIDAGEKRETLRPLAFLPNIAIALELVLTTKITRVCFLLTKEMLVKSHLAPIRSRA